MAVSRIRGLLDQRWLWLVIACFVAVYAASLTFGYIEGDDASSIAYHLYGRDRSIQPPFSPYHSMMDTVLGLLPVNEALLRTVAVGLTSIAAVALVVFMLAIIFDWFRALPLAPRWIIALAVLLASPEFFYLGLVYIPAVIAMALVLAAHLILRLGRNGDGLPDWGTSRGRAALLLSAAVFGVGAACRWDITVYGAVIAADLVFGYGERGVPLAERLRRRWRFSVGWGLLALACFFVALTISGYDPATLVAELRNYTTFTEEYPARIVATIGSLQPLLTPAFALFALVGIITLIRRRDSLLVVVAVGVILIIPWASRGSPKIMLPGVPGLVACAVVGFSTLWTQFRPARWQTAARAAAVALLLLPWLVAVRALIDDSAFGPGFDTRPYDRAILNRPQFELALFEPGALVQTFEGPRGLYGHAAVLLGGAWISATEKRWAELENAVDYAIEQNIPIISTGNISNFVVVLWRRGYTTTDPRNPPGHVPGDPVRREFVNEAGDTLTVFHREIPTTQIERLNTLPEDIEQIVIYGYPRTLRALYEIAPDTLIEKLGPISARLDLERLRRVIDNGG